MTFIDLIDLSYPAGQLLAGVVLLIIAAAAFAVAGVLEEKLKEGTYEQSDCDAESKRKNRYRRQCDRRSVGDFREPSAAGDHR